MFSSSSNNMDIHVNITMMTLEVKTLKWRLKRLSESQSKSQNYKNCYETRLKKSLKDGEALVLISHLNPK